MGIKSPRLTALMGGVALASIAGTVIYLTGPSSAVALAAAPAKPVTTRATQQTLVGSGLGVAAATPMPCPSMPLAIAFTSNVGDTLALHLHLPWGKPGDPEGLMVEDYGAYDGSAVREQLPVYDVTSGSLHVVYGHNAIDIALDSGTPLYAVTSGTVFTMTNWTIPGYPQGNAAVLISDVLRDDAGDPIAFLYGHVREFDTPNWQHVDAGALIARSGGGETDPGRGFSDMPNVHLEVIESPHPLRAGAGTVNPHQFLEDLYTYAALAPAGC